MTRLFSDLPTSDEARQNIHSAIENGSVDPRALSSSVIQLLVGEVEESGLEEVNYIHDANLLAKLQDIGGVHPGLEYGVDLKINVANSIESHRRSIEGE